MNTMAKQTILRSFFVVELVTLSFFYLFGAHGLPIIFQFKKESQQIETEIEKLQKVMNALEKKLNDWHDYSYYKEQIARQQLQMARPDEQIYYLSK
jgi:cell division protein FtsB